MVLVEPAHIREIATMAKRGFKVKVYQKPGRAKKVDLPHIKPQAEWSNPLLRPLPGDPLGVDFPDVEILPLERGVALRSDGKAESPDGAPRSPWGGVQLRAPFPEPMVRFGVGALASAYLTTPPLPACIILTGPVSLAEMKRLRKLGYATECRITRKSWAEGGPVPSVLEFTASTPAAVGEEGNAYLRME